MAVTIRVLSENGQEVGKWSVDSFMDVKFGVLQSGYVSFTVRGCKQVHVKAPIVIMEEQ